MSVSVYWQKWMASVYHGSIKRVRTAIVTQRVRLIPWLIAVGLSVGTLGVIIVVVHFSTHIDVRLFLADPAEIAYLPGYTGAYTYAGGFTLLSAGAVGLFTAAVIKSRPPDADTVPFLVTLGSLILWLGLDDIFMIHEWFGLVLAQGIGSTDVPSDRARLEGFVFVAYGIAWFLWILHFWCQIRESAFMLLALTLVTFGLSVIIDVGVFLFPNLIPQTAWMPTTLSVIEEMLKLAGMFFVFAYVMDTCFVLLRRQMDGPSLN